MQFTKGNTAIYRRMEPDVESFGNALYRAGCDFELLPINNRFATVECTLPNGKTVSTTAPMNNLSPAGGRVVDLVMGIMYP